MQEQYEKYQKRGVAFICIDEGYPHPIEQHRQNIRKVLDQAGITIPIVVDGEGQVSKRYGTIESLIVLIDEKGIIRFKNSLWPDYHPNVTEQIEYLLKPLETDGVLWNSTVTVVPSRATMATYIAAALEAQEQGHELPFVIIRKSSEQIVGTTRFYFIDRDNRHVEIGYTWLAASAQRTAVNTEAKLLLLTHAFELWRCIRVAFITDVLNQQSRAAILRLGAKQEGVLRNHMIMPGGRYRDSVCFSIIEAEWPEVRARLEAKLGQMCT